jgi:hypothetical protein
MLLNRRLVINELHASVHITVGRVVSIICMEEYLLDYKVDLSSELSLLVGLIEYRGILTPFYGPHRTEHVSNPFLMLYLKFQVYLTPCFGPNQTVRF